MKVAVYYSNDDIRIEERPQPQISRGEVLVKMRACGICGTDVMQWYRIKKAPRVLGHEMAGDIVKTGPEVSKFKKGDRVFVSHHVPCYKCRYCSQRKYTACKSLHAGNYDPGGFSEFIRVPEDNVSYGTFILPDSMTYEDATMIEPLGCALAGQSLMEIQQGQAVFIIGSGISGILHIQLAKMKNVRIFAMDINDYRLNKADEFGADYVLNAQEYSPDKLRKINEGRLADVVIVCTAAKEAAENALSAIDRKGRILFFAVPEDDISIPSQMFWRNEIAVSFSYGATPDDLQKAIKLIDRGLINVRKMITHRVTLSDIQKGFKLAAEAKESLKVVVIPDS